MAMEITNNYSSYAAQSVAESSTANSAKKKETEKTTNYPSNNYIISGVRICTPEIM